MVENTAILEEIVGLRQQQAELLGYNDHATYIRRCGWPRTPGTV